MREPPEHFVCDACHAVAHTDLLCPATASPVTLLCVHCCGCDTHRLDDPGGVAVFAAQAGKLTWRGLRP